MIKVKDKGSKELRVPNNIKIVSDGTPYGTTLVNSKTGDKIDGCTKINIEIVAGQAHAKATLEFILPACDIELNKKNLTIEKKDIYAKM
jgi:hypothetical protein